MTGLGDAIGAHYQQQNAEAKKVREATEVEPETDTQPGGFIGLCDVIGRGFEQIQREADYKRSNRNA